MRARAISIRPWWLLAAAMAVATVLILWWAGERSFAIDEWDYVTQREEWTLNNLIRPSNGHLLALPLVAYKGLMSTFGTDSHVPFNLLTIALHLSVVTLFYLLAARRLGSWLALIPTALLLFFGAGWEVMINTAAMQNKFGIAAGLGMLLCLDRGDRRGDVAAGVLLLASLSSFTIGLAFAAGAGIRLLVERTEPGGERDLRRLALVVLPVLAYAVWFVWARQYGQSNLSAASAASIGSGIFDQLSAITAGLTGLFRETGAESNVSGLVTDRTTVLTFALLLLLAFRLSRPPRLSPSAWGALAILLSYLALVAVGLDSDARLPQASRYAYMGGLLVLLAAVELLARVRVSRGWVIAVAAAVALSLIANVGQLRASGDFFELESAYNRAELAALELTREQVDPALSPEARDAAEFSAVTDLTFPAADYFETVDQLGSPAYDEAELAGALEGARGAADEVFVRNLGIAILPRPEAAPPSTSAAPAVDGELNTITMARGSCLVTTPAGPGSGFISVALPSGGFEFSSDLAPPLVGLRRFAETEVAELSGAGRSGAVAIPADASSRPWKAAFELTAELRICPILRATPKAGAALGLGAKPSEP